MVPRVLTLTALAFAVAVSGQVYAAGQRTENSPYMRIYGVSAPPYGFVEFCRSFERECADRSDNTTRFNAGPAGLAVLDSVNRSVNRAVRPATDKEIFGVVEYWTIPGSSGDCEDYAILKRRILIKRGWPPSALLLTVVRDENGEGHAVLTARTMQGDFVLDNKVNEVRLWHDTPYQYLMRQSSLNARVWMSLDPQLSDSSRTVAVISTN